MSPLPADLQERELAPADIPAIVALVERCDATYAEWAAEWTPPGADAEGERWADFFDRPDRFSRGAFDSAGALDGIVAWRRAETESGAAVEGIAHVNAVFTEPRRWGQGIAAHLLALAEAAASDRGFHTARLWTPRDAPARGFYVAQGWTLDGRAKWEPKFRLHLVGFEKRLSG